MDQPALFPHRKPYRVFTRQKSEGWVWRVVAPNHMAVAQSPRTYTTRAAAEEAAANVLTAWRTHGFQVVRR